MPWRTRRLPAVCSRPRKPAGEPLYLAKQPEGERSQFLPVFNSKNNTKITAGGRGPGSMWCTPSPDKNGPKLARSGDAISDALQQLLLYLCHKCNTSEDTLLFVIRHALCGAKR